MKQEAGKDQANMLEPRVMQFGAVVRETQPSLILQPSGTEKRINDPAGTPVKLEKQSRDGTTSTR